MDPYTDTPVAGASQDDRTIAMLTHLSGIIFSFIVPLVVWLINKDKADKAFLVDQSKEALNFQITLLIGMVLTIILIGALINFALWVACIVFSIIAGLKANAGEAYRYPVALRLVK